MPLLNILVRSSANSFDSLFKTARCISSGPLDFLCCNEWHFQQDNATVHNARHTLTFLQENGIRPLGHPACSPDLNPIKNVLAWIAKDVYGNSKQFESVNDLGDAIFRSWSNIRKVLFFFFNSF